MYCKNCGKELNDDIKYCPSCGTPIEKIEENAIVVQNNDLSSKNNSNYVCCPKCGSNNIHFITKDMSSGFKYSNACCGYFLCGPLGLLCGIDNKKDIRTVRKCMNCNHEF